MKGSCRGKSQSSGIRSNELSGRDGTPSRRRADSSRNSCVERANSESIAIAENIIDEDIIGNLA